ncbi:MAG: hypothetical protein LBO77_03610, partial [Desulfovibrio sp.]|nr:hypothetical protein [Desulfovibrio sp.]
GEILEQGRDWGLAHMDKILDAAQASPLPLSRAEYESYFGCLSYTLDERQRQGLLLFWEKLAVAGEIAAVPPLRFL